MAKGSINGVRKGKKGDSVYYKVSGSNNKEKQGERQYVAKVSNPKTTAQVEQRMKLAPAVNFYRAFRDEVLDHSFQGVKYGGRSHSEFMKLAMKMQLSELPYLIKGENQVVPASYIVSKGGLPDIGIVGTRANSFVPSLSLAPMYDISASATFEEFITALINANPMLQKGDQLTMMQIGHDGPRFFSAVARLVLDSTKYDPNANYLTVLESVGLNIDEDGFYITSLGSHDLAGAALILSRPNLSKTNGSVSWLRSTTSFYVVPSVLQDWQREEQLNAAIESYQSASANPTSDWFLNDGTLG